MAWSASSPPKDGARMLISMSLAAALAAAPVALEATPQPEFKSITVVEGPQQNLPLELVKGPQGAHYVLYTRPDYIGWPTLWIDAYSASGERQWSHLHELVRTPAGNGFEFIRAAATDDQGALYFSYFSRLNGGSSGIIKLAADESLTWEAKVEKCWGDARLVLIPGVNDALMSCGSGATRRAQTNGLEVWRQSWPQAAISERYHHAAVDALSNIYIVTGWNGSHTDDHRTGIAAYKVSPEGALLWRKSWEYPRESAPEPKYAFVAKDQGLIAVYLVHNSSAEEVIEVHKLSASGDLLAKHLIEPGYHMSYEQPVVAKHTPADLVHIAWDNRTWDNKPASEWVAASVAFEEVLVGRGPAAKTKGVKPSAAQASASKASASKLPSVWQGKTLMTQKIVDEDHDFLVDMDVNASGRVFVVGVDHDGGADFIRLTALSRVASGPLKTTRYRREGRHARPTRMFVDNGQIVVLGEDDPLAGPNWGSDADVLHLVFAEKAKPKATKRQKLTPTAR